MLVPPDIDESQSSGDLTVTEGGNVTLSCLAHGQPSPVVTWRREDKEEMRETQSPDTTLMAGLRICHV